MSTLFPRYLYHFTSQKTMYVSSSCPTPSPVLSIVSLFNFSYFNRYVEVSSLHTFFFLSLKLLIAMALKFLSANFNTCVILGKVCIDDLCVCFTCFFTCLLFFGWMLDIMNDMFWDSRFCYVLLKNGFCFSRKVTWLDFGSKFSLQQWAKAEIFTQLEMLGELQKCDIDLK